jgi:hypothetical protein
MPVAQDRPSLSAQLDVSAEHRRHRATGDGRVRPEATITAALHDALRRDRVDVGLVLVPVVGKEVDWIAVGHLTIAVETDDECSNLSARDSLEGIEARHGHPVDDTLVMEAVDGVTGFV